MYQLSGIEGLENLDYDDTMDSPEEALGELLLAQRDLFVDPDTVEKIVIEPDPNATHILAVAGFREPFGSAWYSIYRIPLDHGTAVCEHKAANRKKDFPKPLGNPCFYISLEDYRIEGGLRAAPSFERDRFEELHCAPPPKRTKKVPPKKKRKKFKIPKTPQTPETPQAPSTPSKPAKPRLTKPRSPI